MENSSYLKYAMQNAPTINLRPLRSTIHASLKILHPKATIPSAATDGSAGYDLCALIEDDGFIVIEPKQTILIRTGLSIFLDDPNFVGLVHPRSGLGHKHGIVLGNLTGVIDSDYQGELFVSLWNRSDKPYTVNHGDRIAQFVVVPRFDLQFKVVSEFELSGRNSGGFGHTGK